MSFLCLLCGRRRCPRVVGGYGPRSRWSTAPIGYSGRMRPWLALAISAAVVQPGGPSLKDVLAHAAEYVASYHESMAAVVAEERYVQTLTTKDETSPTQRTLLSDFAIVGGEGYQPWMAFRDVLEVDGRAVRDRD